MKLTPRASVIAALFIGLSGVALADDNRPQPKATTRPPPSGYKLDLHTGLNPTNTPAPPPGASTLTRENNNPFLGLKLTKPLGN
jgi:hypothetical protein